MKGKTKTLLAGLVLVPALAFVGCTPPATYSITTYSSNENYGYAHGGSTKKFTDGTQLTLSATKAPNKNSEFLCWVKDYNKVVSESDSFTLTASSATEGKYVAVFAEEELSSMMFASPVNIEYQVENVASLNYEISYANATSSTVYTTLSAGQKKADESIFNGDIVYLGNSTGLNEFYFKVKVNVTFTDSDATLTEELDYSEQTISLLSFDNNGNATISAETETGVTIAITLSKLNSTLFNK